MRQNNQKSSPLGFAIFLLSLLFFNVPSRVSVILLLILVPLGIAAYMLYRAAKQGRPEQDAQGAYPPPQAYDNSEGYENYSSQEAYDDKERYGSPKPHKTAMDFIDIDQNDDARRASELKVLLKAGIIDRAEYDERLRSLKDR